MIDVKKEMFKPSTNIYSGIKSLDNKLGYLKNGFVYTVAAYPGIGASSLIYTMMLNIGKNSNTKSCILSPKTEASAIGIRLLSLASNVDFMEIYDKIDTIDFTNFEKYFANTFVYNDDQHDINELFAQIVEAHNRDNFKVLFIDDLFTLHFVLQQMQYLPSIENRITYAMQQIKSLAKLLNIPIVLVHTLTHDLVKHFPHNSGALKISPDERCLPYLSIQSISDCLIFVSKPAFYGVTTDDEGNSIKDCVFLNVRKNNGGSVGQIQCLFNDKTGEITDYIK